MTTLTEQWAQIVAFNDEIFPGWRDTALIYWTNALAGEVGELCGDAKRMVGGGTNRAKPVPTKAKLAEELADVLIYAVLLAESEGMDEAAFAQAVADKVAECRRRMGR